MLCPTPTFQKSSLLVSCYLPFEQRLGKVKSPWEQECETIISRQLCPLCQPTECSSNSRCSVMPILQLWFAGSQPYCCLFHRCAAHLWAATWHHRQLLLLSPLLGFPGEFVCTDHSSTCASSPTTPAIATLPLLSGCTIGFSTSCFVSQAETYEKIFMSLPYENEKNRYNSLCDSKLSHLHVAIQSCGTETFYCVTF